MKKIIYAVLALGLCATLSAAPATEPLNPESMYLQTTIQPVQGEAVSLDLAKKHLNIEADYHDDDELIQGYIASAVDFVEGYTGRPLIFETVYNSVGFKEFCFSAIAKYEGTTIQYIGVNDVGESEVLDLPIENYQIDNTRSLSDFIIGYQSPLPVLFPDIENVIVKVRSGCPAALKHAVLLKVGEAYAFRENRPVNGVNNSVYNLCRNYRINWS